jgi:hypothetical protein
MFGWKLPPVAAAKSGRCTVHYFDRAFRASFIYTLKAVWKIHWQ